MYIEKRRQSSGYNVPTRRHGYKGLQDLPGLYKSGYKLLRSGRTNVDSIFLPGDNPGLSTSLNSLIAEEFR